MLLVGLGLLGFEIWDLIRKRRCTMEIQAVFIRHNTYSVKGTINYAPVFQIPLGEKVYERQCRDSLNRRQAGEFHPGERYPVWVDPGDHQYVYLSRKLHWNDILMLVLSTIFAVGAVLMIIVK